MVEIGIMIIRILVIVYDNGCQKLITIKNSTLRLVVNNQKYFLVVN